MNDMINTLIRYRVKNIKNEQGFVLVAALASLVVLSLIGLAAMNTSNIEKNIAQNINLAEKSFYGADGGTEVGIEMIEFNLSCPLGFKGTGITDTDPTTFYNIGGVQVADSRLAYRENFDGLAWDPTVIGLAAGTAISPAFYPSDGARSIRIPEDMAIANDDAPHTNLAIFGSTSLLAGGSIIMAAGYDGKGKGAASGGSVINYEVLSQKLGNLNSEAIIHLRWRHLVGMEGECKPY